jgi:hypothetical protein
VRRHRAGLFDQIAECLEGVANDLAQRLAECGLRKDDQFG